MPEGVGQRRKIGDIEIRRIGQRKHLLPLTGNERSTKTCPFRARDVPAMRGHHHAGISRGGQLLRRPRINARIELEPSHRLHAESTLEQAAQAREFQLRFNAFLG